MNIRLVSIFLLMVLLPPLAYSEVFCYEEDYDEEETPRRALPAPFASPPFPSGEYQGYLLIRVPPNDTEYPLMKLLYSLPYGDHLKENRM